MSPYAATFPTMKTTDAIAESCQITVRRPADDSIMAFTGRMRWRAWLIAEKRRLEESPVWAETWIHDDDDGCCALFGRPTPLGERFLGDK